MSECLLNALVAYAESDITVCPSREVQNAMRNILLHQVSGLVSKDEGLQAART